MPTGVALRDARTQLVAAGERVLLRDGPAGLTSRSVTEEADVAKGVLHRHFATFHDFLIALVEQRIAAVTVITSDLIGRVGTRTVTGNVTAALIELFQPLELAVVRLVLVRSDLALDLRGARHGIPMLSEAVDGVTAYLVAEQDAGRLHTSAAPDALASALIGTGHLLFAGELGGLPDRSAVLEIVEGILVGAEPGRPG